MQTGGGAFADGPESVERGAAVRVRDDAAHVIMRRRCNRDRLRHGVDTGGHARGVHGWKTLRKSAADRLAAIEEHAAAARNLTMYGTRHNVARRQLRIGM